MHKLIYLTPLMFALAACATHTKNIQPQYVSAGQYQDYSCSQISQEMGNVSRKATEVGAEQDKIASNDSAQTGIGLVLFWPTLFFLDGDTPQAAEYARLTGEHEALEKMYVQKNCGVAVTESRTVTTTTVDKGNVRKTAKKTRKATKK